MQKKTCWYYTVKHILMILMEDPNQMIDRLRTELTVFFWSPNRWTFFISIGRLNREVRKFISTGRLKLNCAVSGCPDTVYPRSCHSFQWFCRHLRWFVCLKSATGRQNSPVRPLDWPTVSMFTPGSYFRSCMVRSARCWADRDRLILTRHQGGSRIW